MKRFLIVIFFINILTSFGFGQIQVGGNQPKIKKEKSVKKTIDGEEKPSETRVYLGTGVSSTFRTLEPNKNELFAESLGVRADETNYTAWAFHLGFSTDISKYLMWESGISFLRNGEKYAFSETDTSHTYTSKYSWIGVPIKLYFKHDISKFRLQAGVGVIPQMQMKFSKNEIFKNSNNVESVVETKTINGMNNFGVSAVANLGFQYNLSPKFGVFVQFEYRHQLTSSYLKTNAFIHRGTAIGSNFGVVFGL